MAREIKDVVIIDAMRTPVGRAIKGTLKNIRSDDLCGMVIRELVKKVGIDGNVIEDVVIGCAGTEGEQGGNIARNVSIIADLPIKVGATTINRYCASSLAAIDFAASAIAFGSGDAIIAGGMETMSLVPTIQGGMTPEKTFGPSFFERMEGRPQAFTMVQTAQYVAETYDISKEDMDAYALQSHERAIAAIDAGKFRDHTVPVPLRQRTGEDAKPEYDFQPMEKLSSEEYNKIWHLLKNGAPDTDPQKPKKISNDLYSFDTDECPRRGTTLERIAMLPPVTGPITRDDIEPIITAGNSSQLNDAAGAALLMSADKAKELGLKPIARLVSFAVAGVEPYEMGIGPSQAIPKALKRAGLKIEDIGLVEINEAFASIVLANMKLLEKRGIKLDMNTLNVNGGGISIGHPLGATGVRICSDLIYEMKRRNVKYGLESMCVGGGQGEAAIFELL